MTTSNQEMLAHLKIRYDLKSFQNEWLLVNQQEAFLCQFGMHDSVLKQRKILPGSLPKYKTVFINYFLVSSMMWYIFHIDAIIQTLLLRFIFCLLWNHSLLHFSRHGTTLCILPSPNNVLLFYIHLKLSKAEIDIRGCMVASNEYISKVWSIICYRLLFCDTMLIIKEI